MTAFAGVDKKDNIKAVCDCAVCTMVAQHRAIQCICAKNSINDKMFYIVRCKLSLVKSFSIHKLHLI